MHRLLERLAFDLRRIRSSVDLTYAYGACTCCCAYARSGLTGAARATRGRTWIVGLVIDASEVIHSNVFPILMDLNCNYSASIHITASVGIDECLKGQQAVSRHESGCGAFHVETQPAGAREKFPNRIDRIAHLRDFQRGRLRHLMGQVGSSDIVIVVDLDLHRLPDVNLLVRNAERVRRNPEYDALCAAGTQSEPFGYYDIFATVLLPGTFLFPIAGRLVPKFHPGEEPSQVPVAPLFHKGFEKKNPCSALQFFEKEAKKQSTSGESGTAAVMVKSCFGGLTIYKAAKYFSSDCQYSNGTRATLRYASKKERRACEHVVFHLCLREQDPSFSIAVDPFMQTTWKPPINRLFATDNKQAGSNKKKLVFYSDPRCRHDESSLVNGDYSVQMRDPGQIAVIKTTRSQFDPKSYDKIVLWTSGTPSLNVSASEPNIWFLSLKPDGELELKTEIKNRVSGHNWLCGKTRKFCVMTAWSNGYKQPFFRHGSYELILGGDGILRIVNSLTNHSVWSTASPATTSVPQVARSNGYQQTQSQHSSLTNRSVRAAPPANTLASQVMLTDSHSSDGDLCPSKPRPVWLATFPNSGTSYTLALVQAVTNTAIGTVYGANECQLQGCSDRELGPSAPRIKTTVSEFQRRPFKTKHEATHPAGCNCILDTALGWVMNTVNSSSVPLPCSRLIVKTHCGGYDLKPRGKGGNVSGRRGCQGRIDTQRFIQCCGGTLRRDFDFFEVPQEPSALAGIIHLWRDPTDNLMSRFHHERKRGVLSLPNTPQGFQEFVQQSMVAFMHTYTHWHCNMLRMQKEGVPGVPQGVPVLTVDYEDYRTRFAATLDRLLKFLHLKPDPVRGGYVPFKKTAENYSSWYTTAQYEEAKRLGIIYYRKNNQERLELDCTDTKSDAHTDTDANTGARGVQTPRRSIDQRPHSLIFVHPHKVGGSTVRGVRNHIARKFSLQIRNDWIKGRNGGGHAAYMEIASKAGAEIERAFLLTWVRHPVHRCLSAFNWFAVTNQGIAATDDNLIKFANEDCRDYIAQYLGMPEEKALRLHQDRGAF